MSDDLSERFKKHKRKASDAGDTNGSSDAYDTDDSGTSGEAGDSNNTGGAYDTDDADDKTRNRKQVAMYLPEDLREELNDRYDRLDGQSKIDGAGGIEKHKDFFEGLVRCALDSDDLDSYVLERAEEDSE